MTDKCIMCGEVIPEGRQVCSACEKRATYNENLANEMRDLHQRGKSYGEISNRFKVARSTVRSWINFPPKPRKKRDNHDDICEQIHKMKLEGKTWQEISDYFNIPTGTLAPWYTQYKLRNGLYVRHRPRRTIKPPSGCFYTNLRIAIIEQAIEDYEKALFNGWKQGIKEMREWFNSEWADLLTDGNGALVERRVADYMSHLHRKVKRVDGKRVVSIEVVTPPTKRTWSGNTTKYTWALESAYQANGGK